MPPTPSTRSMPYFPPSVVPTRRDARSSRGMENALMTARARLPRMVSREPRNQRRDAFHVLGVFRAAGHRAAIEQRDRGEDEQQGDGERARSTPERGRRGGGDEEEQAPPEGHFAEVVGMARPRPETA